MHTIVVWIIMQGMGIQPYMFSDELTCKAAAAHNPTERCVQAVLSVPAQKSTTQKRSM